MNRNVNMTGNFSNAKSLKPGDTAFNSRKLTGGDNYGNRVTNTNSNFNARTTNSNLGADKYKFNENDMNEAKESLKLLKLKMGGGIGSGSNPVNNMPTTGNRINMNTGTNNYGGYGNSANSGNTGNINKNMGSNMNNMNTMNTINTMSHNSSSNNQNSNYRKPFKPNFNNEPSENIPTETTKKIMNNNSRMPMNSNSNTTNKYGNNNNHMQQIQNSNTNKNTNMNMNKKFEIKELEDDRPAFATGVNNLEIEEEDDGADDGDRIECPTCGRRFKEEAYEKHSKVCKKVFASKRKTFDMTKKRIIDSEHAMMLKHKEFEDKKKAKMGIKEGNNQKKQKWKKQSEEFRAIMRANQTTSNFTPSNNNRMNTGPGQKMGITGNNYNQQRSGTSGGQGFTHTPSAFTEDYTHCNMCNRRYNENAYSKHLPTCERRTKEAAMKSKGKPGTGSMTSNTMTGTMMTGNTGAYGSKPNLNVKFGRK